MPLWLDKTYLLQIIINKLRTEVSDDNPIMSLDKRRGPKDNCTSPFVKVEWGPDAPEGDMEKSSQHHSCKRRR